MEQIYDGYLDVLSESELLELAVHSKKSNLASRYILEAAEYKSLVTSAHETASVRAFALVGKAHKYLEIGDNDEAVFCVARALEGYIRAVYLIPFCQVVFGGVAAAFPEQPNSLYRGVIPNQLKDSKNLLHAAFTYLTGDEKDARRNMEAITKTFESKTSWNVRNTAFHTLAPVQHSDAMDLIKLVEGALQETVRFAEKITQHIQILPEHL